MFTIAMVFSSIAAESNECSLGERFIELLPGQYFDAETNTHYNYYRDYDPSQGRYIESDPLGLSAGLGTYIYVDNTPIAKIDLLGLASGPDPKDACKLMKNGNIPDNDPCGCQRDVINDLCGCWTKYSAFYQVAHLSLCTQNAYLKKSRCVQNCSLMGCSGSGGATPKG